MNNVRMYRGDYLHEFLRTKCSADFIAWNLFPDLKEICESFGLYRAVMQNIPYLDPSDPNVTVIVVGDGSTPRTAATFACRTAWDCHSVDPELSRKQHWDKIQRLTVYRSKIQDLKFLLPEHHKVLAIFPHSHVKVGESLKSFFCKELTVVALPCCTPLYLSGRDPDIEFDDENMNTEKCHVKIYHNVRGNKP